MAGLETDITTNAQGPKQVTGDEGSVTQHSLPDQIAADEYVKNQVAARRSGLPIRFAKIRPGGPTS